jgi:hypothetical protein
MTVPVTAPSVNPSDAIVMLLLVVVSASEVFGFNS